MTEMTENGFTINTEYYTLHQVLCFIQHGIISIEHSMELSTTVSIFKLCHQYLLNTSKVILATPCNQPIYLHHKLPMYFLLVVFTCFLMTFSRSMDFWSYYCNHCYLDLWDGTPRLLWSEDGSCTFKNVVYTLSVLHTLKGILSIVF